MSRTKEAEVGKCYLVGAGPGDLGLVTLKAKRCVEKADVVVYDYLSNPAILRWAQPGAELIYAGKKAKNHAIPQGGINALLIEKAKSGKTVTRLKGGDPMIFGRGGEEAQELREAGVPFEIVPGISSAIAGPAYAGIPVTHRAHNSQLTIFTGHEDPTKVESSIDYVHLAKTPGTKVFLMGVERIGAITGELVKAGADAATPVALVRWATTERQESLVGTLEDIAAKVKEANFKAPAVCVVGDVVGLREEIGWFEDRPLFGKKIVVTRTRKQAGVLSEKLRDLGADAYEIPTIRIDPPLEEKDFARLVIDAHTYSWIVFTSPNGVEAFFEMFYRAYKDARSIGGARIAAIGPGTAKKIKEYHLAVDVLPEEYVAESLVEAILKEAGSVEHEMMLWVKAEKTREVVGEKLTEAGAIVDEAISYRTVAETGDVSGGQERFKTDGADVITFTSSSTVEHFLDLGLPMPEGVKIASIGPITSETLRENGLNVDIEATRFDIPGLVEAIERYYA
ncbi:MAG: uroporphyrinogen-III C-methyltransferase [Verrucomicrobiales bacterium]|nr:uroporphyrinogen-III C-methyltransferase [Verrucomicrobiales bacterium]